MLRLLALLGLSGIIANALPIEIGAQRSRRVLDSTYVTFQNDKGQCLSSDGDKIVWKSIDAEGLLLFRNDYKFWDKGVFTVGPMFLRDNKNCLIVTEDTKTKMPVLKILPCMRGAALLESGLDKNQEWVIGWGDDKRETRSRTLLGVCRDAKGVYKSCPFEESGPMCLSDDKGAAVVRQCREHYKAVPVVYDMKKVFTWALTKTQLPQVKEFFVGKVLESRNDKTITVPWSTSVPDLISKCYAECLKLKCTSFDVVYDKSICNFSITSGGTSKDLKDDPDATVFFIKK